MHSELSQLWSSGSVCFVMLCNLCNALFCIVSRRRNYKRDIFHSHVLTICKTYKTTRQNVVKYCEEWESQKLWSAPAGDLGGEVGVGEQREGRWSEELNVPVGVSHKGYSGDVPTLSTQRHSVRNAEALLLCIHQMPLYESGTNLAASDKELPPVSLPSLHQLM